MWALDINIIGAGRRHQIRAGLAYLGCPLVGDEKYGGWAWSLPGVALHAQRIVVDGIEV